MKKVRNFLSANINKRDMVTNTIVGILLLTFVACGGPAAIGHLGQKTEAAIFSGRGTSSHLSTSGSGVSIASMLAMFQAGTTPTPSQQPQSFDFVCSVIGSPTVNAPTDLLPLFPDSTPGDAGFGTCHNTLPSTGAIPSDAQGGKQIITDGTIEKIVVIGHTTSGLTQQCRDFTSTTTITDNSIVAAYAQVTLGPTQGTVQLDGAHIFVQPPGNVPPTEITFTCTLPSGDGSALKDVEIMFTKQ